MSKIPFVRQFEFEYAKAQAMSPLVTRVIANNPGPFTFTGTGVFIIGTDDVAVIDPGPNNAEHFAALDEALAGKTVSHVFVTHHHIDHTPLAHPLAEKYGCKVYGYGQQTQGPDGGEVRMEAGDDLGFQPDIKISDGDVFKGSNWTLEAIHTPGHTSNHMCYALTEENTLFSGDHIMGWSTSIVSPPDGSMKDYLRCLEDIKRREFSIVRPTHGPEITKVTPFIQAYIDHRYQREEQICASMKKGASTISEIVEIVYADIDKRLHPAASLSVLAHMVHMQDSGRITCCGDVSLKSEYTLPH
jgi:glyoxylase-like metal-dependent hydrolase (beta-lactamase superfamily II)